MDQVLTLNPNGSTTRLAFDKNFYPLSSGPLQVAKLPDDANDMTLTQAFSAEKIESDAGNIKAARKLRVRIQEKFSFPMACIVFGLIGSSLGARPGSRTSRSQGFGVSILLILGYYALSVSFSSLGVSGIPSTVFGRLASSSHFTWSWKFAFASGQSVAIHARLFITP